ncbi:hypothetical protein D3C78_1232330 [compost metagenome]
MFQQRVAYVLVAGHHDNLPVLRQLGYQPGCRLKTIIIEVDKNIIEHDRQLLRLRGLHREREAHRQIKLLGCPSAEHRAVNQPMLLRFQPDALLTRRCENTYIFSICQRSDITGSMLKHNWLPLLLKYPLRCAYKRRTDGQHRIPLHIRL